ncbi:hypothetical protein H0H87_008244 [Tephrocybe sp. NHM501043]|nr:hypothetical protein H0H87_008244 [Tephrocybe sp. NHM501043]
MSGTQAIKVYVLQAKLDPSAIAELYSTIEGRQDASDGGLHLQLCGNASDADIIITNVHMRRRLERHLDWNIAVEQIATLLISCSSLKPLSETEGDPLEVLRDETAKNCLQCELRECRCSHGSPQKVSLSRGATSRAITNPEVISNYAAPTELGVLRMHRDLEGKAVNALSYERAIAVVKSFPQLITRDNFDKEVVHLPHLGQKICSKIKEFTQTGSIEECGTIRSSQRFQSLKDFTTIHNVGATTARHLYSIGLRSIEDMERYYDVPMADDSIPLLIENEPIYTPNGKRVPLSLEALDFDIKAALALRHDLATFIPRTEVEEIHNIVMSEIEGLKSGCASTIVGGYRRGKLQSNDVDIVITHSDLRSAGDHVKTLSKRVVQRLYERGMLLGPEVVHPFITA